MSLQTITLGSGPELFLVHGWGLNASIWSTTADILASEFRVTCVDLPGHGQSELNGAFTLDRMSDALLEVAPQRATWIAWSLGGMLAMAAARKAPERFEQLLLVASSPRFVRDPQWPHAIEPAVFDRFEQDLAEDYNATLNRFLSLQVRGSDQAGATLRTLRNTINARGAPQPDALAAGLDILGTADLREDLAHIETDTLFLMGERDTLMPAAAGDAAAAHMPHARTRTIAGAGHAPFLSHPEAFAEQVRAFLQEGVAHG